MEKSSVFQIVILSVSGVLLLVGVGLFATYGGLLGGTNVGKVVMWGTADSAVTNGFLEQLATEDKSFQDVNYAQKNPATYEADLINAIASGSGPDLVMLPQESILRFSDKIQPIPYGSVSQRTFLDSYIDEAALYLGDGGSAALPLLVDPLVMYWNRDLLSSAGVAEPPRYWNQLVSLAPKLTKVDASKNISLSAVAMGQWVNIENAKALLAALFMQAGDPIVKNDADGTPQSVFGATPLGAPENPAQAALRFYTEFANPSKENYSWNRSLPKSFDAFTAGNLGIYFGFASELPRIAARNPSLRFGVAPLPQIEGNGIRLTYATLTGVVVPKNAANPSGALAIAIKLSDAPAVALAASRFGLPAVRRDLLLETPQSAVGSVFVQSALMSRAWLDPSPVASSDVFQRMVESVISGRLGPADAVTEGARSLERLFPRKAVEPEAIPGQ